MKSTLIVLSLWPLSFSVIYQKFIHCGQLDLRKISKFDATKCQILRLKCTKFDFRWGSAPNRAEGLQHSPDPVAVFKGAISRGKRGGKGDRGREVKGLAEPVKTA